MKLNRTVMRADIILGENKTVEYDGTATTTGAAEKLGNSPTTTSHCSGIIAYLASAYRPMCSSTDLLEKDGLVGIQKTGAARESFGRLATDVSADAPSAKNMQRNGADDQNVEGGVAASLKAFLLVAIVSVSMLEFSLWLPFVIPGVSSAAEATYLPAWYEYDEENTKFDNTPWTYGTDYVLTAVMTFLAILCLRASAPEDCPQKDQKNRESLGLRRFSASLLICYALSTLAGGWAHQHFTSVESLNTTRFRAFWIVCVGNVSFASCYMGLIGREVQRVFGVKGAIPLGPWWFWPAYGSYMAVACGLGYISFKRPACDIFIAGISQAPTTFYCLGALGLRRWPSSKAAASGSSAESPIDLVRLPYRAMYYIGFIGNSPLLPMYPMLVQYTGMSLAGINTLLHSWLMVMWGFQGLSLLHLCKAMSSYTKKSSKD